MARPVSLLYLLHAGLLVVYPGLMLAIGLWAYRRNSGPLGKWFLVGTVMNACWGLTVIVQFFTASLATKAFLYQYVKTIFVWGSSFSWLMVALYYAGLDQHVRRFRIPLGVAYVVIVGSQLVFISQGLVWSDFRIVAEPFRHMEYTRLDLFWVYTAVGQVVVGTAAVLVLETMRRAGRVRLQPALFAASMVIITVADMGTRLDLFFVPGFDYAGPAGIVTAGVLGYLVARHRLMTVAPLSRHDVMEAVHDGVVAVSADRLLLDYNSRSTDLFPALADAVGEPLDTVAPELVDDDADPPFVDELTLDTPEGRRTFTVGTDRLESPQRNRGWTITLHDVTEVVRYRSQIEEKNRRLAEQTEDLQLIKQVLSRVLRHNVRNELTVVRGTIQTLADGHDHLDEQQLYDRILESTQSVIRMSERVRAFDRLIEPSEDDVVDLVSAVERAVDDTATEFPDVEFQTRLPTESVPVPGVVIIAVHNLAENAARHNEGSNQWVRITLQRENGTATVTVTDNGPGIPDQEVKLLDRGEESPLEHGSGVGLWLVDMVIDRVDGDHDFEITAEGTTATLSVPISVNSGTVASDTAEPETE